MNVYKTTGAPVTQQAPGTDLTAQRDALGVMLFLSDLDAMEAMDPQVLKDYLISLKQCFEASTP